MSKIPAYALVKVSRTIDFGEITLGCNLSAIGLSVWDCSEAWGNAGRLNPQMAKLGECRQAKSPKGKAWGMPAAGRQQKKLTNASFSCP